MDTLNKPQREKLKAYDLALNAKEAQIALAENFDTIYHVSSAETKEKMEASIAKMRSEYKLPHRAIKALLFVAMLEAL